MTIQTAGGVTQVEWDDEAATSIHGQMPFFIEFLTATKLFSGWEEDCPLVFSSPNAPRIRDVLGTWLMAILSGHKRFSHVTALRHDGVNPRLLEMDKVISEDSLRRALLQIDEGKAKAWMQKHLDFCCSPVTNVPWVLDVDTTVKCIYGQQEGAVIGYNPKKPGRPSHTYHTYMMAHMRLVLDVDVLPGNENHSKQSMPGLVSLLERLTSDQRPQLVRGDCDFGTQTVMSELEEMNQSYLFKLRLSKNVKNLIERNHFDSDWTKAGADFEAKEGKLKLTGWTKERRVVILRRRLAEKSVTADNSQGQLAFVENIHGYNYEYAVLVTNSEYALPGLAQLYRDRADIENAFDELKNQWGWGGFTSRDLARNRLSARGVALIYNWWSLFVRLAHPDSRLEAITSRPLLLTAIAKLVRHAGQTKIKITSSHGKKAKAKALLSHVHQTLTCWKTHAEQLTRQEFWKFVCFSIIHAVLRKYHRPLPFLISDVIIV